MTGRIRNRLHRLHRRSDRKTEHRYRRVSSRYPIGAVKLSSRLFDERVMTYAYTLEATSRPNDRTAKRPRTRDTMKKSTVTKKKSVTKLRTKKKTGPASPSQLITARIKELNDWRGKLLAQIRALIQEADPEVVEEWKWRGVPVWSHAGIICTGETYKSVVKMTFAKGAALKDPSRLFNSSLEGNTRRAIDFHKRDQINEKALTLLIRSAMALNIASRKK